MKNDLVLFIVEGASAEPAILKSILPQVGFQENQIYSYKTNIYPLFREVEEILAQGIESDQLDLVALLQEKEMEKDSGQQHELASIPRKRFSQVFLIFDLDAHHTFIKDRKDTEGNLDKVEALLKLFDNEHQLGKLYISYPMIEALTLYHQPEEQRLNLYQFKLDANKNQAGKRFKAICNEDPKSHLLNQPYSLDQIEWIKTYQVWLSTSIYDQRVASYEGYRDHVSTRGTFDRQLVRHRQQDRILIFSAIGEFLLDYFTEEHFPKMERDQVNHLQEIDLWASQDSPTH